MFFSCNCLNIVGELEMARPECRALERFDVDFDMVKHSSRKELTTAANAVVKPTTPSDDHFLFFKEALGPARSFNVQVQFDRLLQREHFFAEFELIRCRICNISTHARHKADDDTASATNTCLINPSVIVTKEQLSARMAGENYSGVFGIVLDGPSLSYSDLLEKDKLLSKAKSDNQFMERLRAYTERETQAANERIQHFSQQEFAVLKVKRERAEQDYMILAKLAANNQVPDDLLLERGSSNNGGQHTVARTTAVPVANSNGTNLNDSSGNSQLETPPPTPENQPMSTGNSPPMMTANGHTTNNRQQPITPSSSSSMVDQSPFTPSANARLNDRILNRANLSYNNANNHINNNNNNIVSYNNSRGAINRQQPQQPTTTVMQHSSTNSLTMQHQQQQRRVASYETDCMFQLDGMDNDNSPLSNTLSDEEEPGYDESADNNNDDGMCKPSRQLGRQNSSIARSLPISMPQQMMQFRTNEEDLDELTEDNVDIAASIKALARSVHGDALFGDLPRPQIQRFNTQI